MVKVIMYADDGIIFAEDEALITAVINYLSSVKIEIEESKSGYIKKSGN
jgi:hypothetical protein